MTIGTGGHPPGGDTFGARVVGFLGLGLGAVSTVAGVAGGPDPGSLLFAMAATFVGVVAMAYGDGLAMAAAERAGRGRR